MVAACGAPRDAGPPRRPDGALGDVTDLVAEADRELVVSRSFDYRAPREPVRRDAQDRAVALLSRACKLGDARSCWRAIELPDHARLVDSHAMAMVVGRQCLAGHVMSCRALRAPKLRESGLAYDGRAAETDALCAEGLAAACYGAGHRVVNAAAKRRRWLQKGCDLGDAWSCDQAAELDRVAGKPAQEVDPIALRAAERARVECDEGFADSCLYLAVLHRGDMTRVEATAKEGCAAGMYNECDALTRNDIDPAVRAHAMEEACALRGIGCNILAAARTDPIGIRDAYEHGCQLGERQDCLALAKRYRAGDFAEPVPGRGHDLTEYLCKTRDVAEACALAKN